MYKQGLVVHTQKTRTVAILFLTPQRDLVLKYLRSPVHEGASYGLFRRELTQGESLRDTINQFVQREFETELNESSLIINLLNVDYDSSAYDQRVALFLVTNVNVSLMKWRSNHENASYELKLMNMKTVYERLVHGRMHNPLLLSSILKGIVAGYFHSPAVLPTQLEKAIFESSVDVAPVVAYLERKVRLQLRVLETLRVEYVLTPIEGFHLCEPELSQRGILEEAPRHLKRVSRYLKRPSKRSNGTWLVKLPVRMAVTLPERGVGIQPDDMIPDLNMLISQESDAQALASAFDRVCEKIYWFSQRRFIASTSF